MWIINISIIILIIILLILNFLKKSEVNSLEYKIERKDNDINFYTTKNKELLTENQHLQERINSFESGSEYESLISKLKEQETILESYRYFVQSDNLKYEKNLSILKLQIEEAEQEKFKLKSHIDFLEKTNSNLTIIPYMASIMADYETYKFEFLAKQLDWGRSVERKKKVAAIREIRHNAKEIVQQNFEAKYQLEYLLKLFPTLEDVIETDYKQLPIIDIDNINEYDRTRDWLSKEEYKKLDSIERNQLALDRYKASHNKTKWQIGRDYELFIGHKYLQIGYTVDFFGSYMGMEDLGRDLIAKKGDKTLIIQCKYWSQAKLIHEKHIMQLYGTVVCYCLENNISPAKVTGILYTNTHLSETAKKMADYLQIKYLEELEKGDYPCIKCNIGHSEYGTEKIYHLPFDQQYDIVKIDKKGEFYATTVKEAEDAGFRRAFKWFGN